MKKKINVGNVIEIPVEGNLHYAQYSHNHVRYGALLRVLRDVFDKRPDGFLDLVKRPEVFVTFFPLQAAINQKIFEIVADCPVPDFAKPFPLFRTGIEDPVTHKVKTWWLWDGEKEWKIGSITAEQRKLPLRGIWNDTLLIERLKSGWTPVSDPT